MDLFATARACRTCASVAPGTAVLSPRNGVTPCGVLFIGEAPGRHGAGRTGIPFSGDVAGRRFERLLAEAGLSRSAAFITNAVLCLPLDSAGRNRTPTSREAANCSAHLAATLEMVDPAVVVTLGASALRALGHIAPHGLSLREAVGEVHHWRGRTLAPLYHTGQRAQVHRSWQQQASDWRRLGALVRELAASPLPSNTTIPSGTRRCRSNVI